MNEKSKIRKLWKSMTGSLSRTLPAFKNEKNGGLLEIDIVHQESTANGNITEFWFCPNADITINHIEIQSGSHKDEIIPDSKTIFEKDQWYQFVGFENVIYGQKWQFVFIGLITKIGRPFKRTASYTIHI